MKEESRKLLRNVRFICCGFGALSIVMGVIQYVLEDSIYSSAAFFLMGLFGFFNLSKLLGTVDKIEEGKDKVPGWFKALQPIIIVAAVAALVVSVFWVYHLF